MDSFTSLESLDGLFASIETLNTLDIANPMSQANPTTYPGMDVPTDQERYGSGTTTAFCVI
ncbi:hypothetical protein B0H34DRAFT_719318, partial [Crassisporium funariophilum]